MNAVATVAIVAAVGITAAVLIDRELSNARRDAFGGFGGWKGILSGLGDWVDGLNTPTPAAKTEGSGSDFVDNFDWDNPNFDPIFSG